MPCFIQFFPSFIVSKSAGRAGPGRVAQTGNDRTAVLFTLRNEPGVLIEALTPLRDFGINMTALHSIPLVRPGEYAFYCEFDTHARSEAGAHIIDWMCKKSLSIRILGSYPKAV